MKSFSDNQKVLIDYAINKAKSSNISKDSIKEKDKDYVIELNSYVNKNSKSYSEFLDKNSDLIRDLRFLKMHYPIKYETKMKELENRENFKFIEFTLDSSEKWFAKFLVASYNERAKEPATVQKKESAVMKPKIYPFGMAKIYEEL